MDTHIIFAALRPLRTDAAKREASRSYANVGIKATDKRETVIAHTITKVYDI